MALFHWSTIFKATTVPANLALASIRQGGWSEGFWTEQPVAIIRPMHSVMANLRARLLGSTCTITGYRVQEYQIAGNKLLPLGATNGKMNVPGWGTLTTDIPQMAMSVNLTGLVRPNTSSYKLAAFPDTFITGGEFNGTGVSIGAFANYFLQMRAMQAGFVGRDLSQGTTRVLSVVAGILPNEFILTTAGDVPGLVTGDFVRFLRSYTDTKIPISGAFRVTRTAVGIYTVHGKLPGINVNPSGLVRKDLAVFVEAGLGEIGRAETKKIGRPSGQYRGRASNRR